ncbi:formimidoylglutamate deiminase [Spiractinospora alimapuensis]|nr:formimidoylglutamate deiminase [Spiractinospora alimapuensis]QVQ55126.1 formimidoylglutamate deiminase [Spiractinospora alimapuensis]
MTSTRSPEPDRGHHWYWCEWAWTGRGGNPVEGGVTIGVDTHGRIVSVVAGTTATAEVERLPGVTLAGFANSHSHAFHRALRGRTHGNGGSFWTWREQMYRVAERLTPESYYRLARGVYAEMALAGVTAVGEFHYLHHGPDGTPYSDPNVMGSALVAAAADAGIRITVLDTCYLAGGLSSRGGPLPLAGPQARFGDGDSATWAARVDGFRPDSPHARVGAGVHSVRAVPADQIPTVAEWARRRDAPLHVHVSEQPAENEACGAAYGLSPTRVLERAGALGNRTSLVHATHLDDGDITAVRSSGSAVCLCPTTERDLADGLPRLHDLTAGDAEDPPAVLTVGTDQHAQVDMFEEMRGVELHERLRSGRRGTLAPAALHDAAGAAGHVRLGWGGVATPEAGILRPGARADLVTVSLDSIRLSGFDPEHAAGALVYAATAADIRHVMADGRWIVRDGAHVRVPDTADALDAAIKEVLT